MHTRHPRHRLRTSKLRPPETTGLVPRPRVTGAIAAALETHPLVLVVAAAGSGKTTAVAQFAATRPAPVAWLTLDEWDSHPGRLAAHLAAAVETLDAAAGRECAAMLEDGLPPAECAACLAEQIPAGGVVVVDDVHNLAGRDVREVLRAFVRHVPPAGRVLLAGRRLPALGLERDALAHRAGGVFDRDLAFTEQETARLLEARGVDGDPERLRRATGGWVAGLVFDAATAADRPLLPPGEDGLFAYLASEIGAALPAELREVMLASGVLDHVTPARLDRLLDAPHGRAWFDALVREHLPSACADGVLRYHPRFREFLVHTLRAERPERAAELTGRFGRILADEGFAEEAVDALLAAGRAREAEPLAGQAVGALLRRGDWDKVVGWTRALGEDAVRGRPALRGAQIRALLLGRRQPELERLVDGMLATGEVRSLVAEAPDVVGWAVWALHGSGEWARLLPLLPDGVGGRVGVVRHLFSVSASPDPAPPLPDHLLDSPQPLHVALQSACYYQGRFDAVDRLAAAAAARGPVTQALGQIFRIAALRERGDLAAARAALDAVAQRVRASRYLEFWHHVEGELLFEEGRHDDGVALLHEARRLSAVHGYRIGEHAIFPAVEGALHVRMGALDEAERLLAGASAWCAERGLVGFGEWADTWWAAGRLRAGGDAAEARARLRAAADGMARAGRRLHLAACAVFLAEAEWRCGDETAHDAACDQALRTAEAQGTLGPLRRALDVFPDVLARRVDADADHRSVWHRLLHGAVSDREAVPERVRVLVRTLGGLGLEVDGVPVSTGLGKAVELAAAVAAAGPGGPARAHLAQTLFRDDDRGRTYLRQAVHRLRRTLPPDVALVTDGGRLRWAPHDAVATEDGVVEALMGRARRAIADERLRLLREAVALCERGDYLPGATGERVEARRRHLAALEAEARSGLAWALLEQGQAGQAGRLALAALARDPVDEDAWQALLRAEAALRGPEGVGPVLQRCLAALAEAGLDPCEATIRLAERLRRPIAVAPGV